ncbi:LpxL/LpxP family acyltransferase [Moraxella pluranimalium]|uniref:Lipid A biosynthesis acyltransferase n=1 Tax=Moraxella pluranimalium TaxID=470453 RepID=A0A1T0CSB1_9GAMM|nr:lipid A biosynthesis acyltransferase [Moraxella pluranimalium]OOS25109.1 lipid A biosynthesis acyltransferase [Moraxella pluranimalium]
MSCDNHQCGCGDTKPVSTTPAITLTDNHKQTHIAEPKPFQWAFLHPKNWGFWLAMALILPLIYLPLRIQFMIGRAIGKLVFKFVKRRVNDTLTNLKLAFPNKTDDERQAIARQVFINQGIGIFESLCAWFRPNVFVRSFSISGLQHLVNAQKDGKAVILLGGHYTTLDLGGRLCTQFFGADCVYRPQNNALLEWFIYNARRRIFDEQISSRDMKKLITRIKAGRVIWYSPDQDFGLEHGVMATFFGVPAATITAQRRLAKMGDKSNPPAVMMMDMVRQTPDFIPSGRRPHYHITLSPALENYPSADEVADAERINRLIEANIQKDVSQWMWFHRRFKNQADGTNYYQK